MALLDWIVIAIFFAALIGIIVWVMRQKHNTGSFSADGCSSSVSLW